MGVRLTIRRRDRSCYVYEAGCHTTWTEWQVINSRQRVVARFDFEHQAIREKERLEQEDAALAE